MFIGEYKHTIDDKGRLAIPSKFRAQLAQGTVVTRGLDKCLFMYPKAEWEQIAGKIAGLPLTQSNARAFARLMLAGAMDVDIDKQGRVVLPAYLRQYAGISTQAVVAGLYNRVEIWNDKVWSEYQSGSEKNSEDIAENLANLGV
ncbi:MAG: division/cell wall cluster transcriptional repressor MraZ [bacterium]|nr:division/cell wall cluster transcriptional repressor MraZ [bacterium]